MGLFDRFCSLFTDTLQEERASREEAVRLAFKNRCRQFKALLSANKRALESMANLEEALNGGRFFSMSFVRANCTNVITNVFNMIRQLNALCDNAYPELPQRLRSIQQQIAEALAPPREEEPGPLVLPLRQAGFSVAHETGAKMAGLGEAWQQLGRDIPEGFVVTASGYRRFIEANDLREEIARRMQLTDLSRLEEVFALSASLQELIVRADMPEDLVRAMDAECDRLEHAFGAVRLAVRSSAIGEDAAGVSHAGQYRSELNVARTGLVRAYKEVVASKYSVTAMTYRFNRGIPDHEVPMCVGCMLMVDALAGGVAYSSGPLSREARQVVINAVPGLPRAVVDGSAPVDVFRVSRQVPLHIESRSVARKTERLACAFEEGIVTLPLAPEEQNRPALTDAQVLEVAGLALGFEVFYGEPQDVEWAYSPEGRLVVLQTRPLSRAGETEVGREAPEGAEVLFQGGVTVSAGVGAGPVFPVRHHADMLRFPRGAVLVVEQAHARWAPVLARASALVSESGGTAGHLASVAREYGIPALFEISGAGRLAAGTVVTVDATSRRIFKERVEELLGRVARPRQPFSETPVYRVLEQAARHIVPLHLLDPESPEFAPGCCRTLHDITRFSHEKAVEAMFRTDDALFSGRFGKQLRYRGSKLQYFVVNIENGFCSPVEGGYVELDQICSAPMHALWQGMTAIPWSGPVSTSARGFLAVVAESASNPDLEVTSAPTRMVRNYFLVDRDFCNLQASFGYHFCTIEAQAGETEQENYVSFHFKGGAANLARRKLRVLALADILAENGFLVDVREDALSARAEALLASEALELLHILGYLIVHTRQLDAGLQGEDSRVALADALRKGVAEIMRLCGPA